MDPPAWCLIESDPGVFSQLCELIGVKDVQFEEIYSIEEQAFEVLKQNHTPAPLADSCDAQELSGHNPAQQLPDIHGFIFLFKWEESAREAQIEPNPDPELFFAKQVVRNACATQAILSVLLNRPNIDIGTPLRDIKEFSKHFDAHMRGCSISNSDALRKAHNSFATERSFDVVEKRSDEKEDAFHYVSFVPFKGKVYELDGLKEGPVVIGEADEREWLQVARVAIEERIRRIQMAGSKKDASEIRFNLLAIVGDKIKNLQETAEEYRRQRQRAVLKLISLGEDLTLSEEVADECAEDAIEKLPNDVEELGQLVNTLCDKIQSITEMISGELEKRQKWKVENKLRCHDFVPFVLCTLRNLSRLGELESAFQSAKVRVRSSKERSGG